VALAWCFPDETNSYANSVLKSMPGSRIVVPAHWTLEVANGLLMAERRGRTSGADTARAIQLLEALPIDLDPRTAERVMSNSVGLARSHKLTVYDAAYLELCMREALALATIDAQLLAACKASGCAVYTPAA
jgi:predicted nucleic acid-binding protein